ncbi:MAG: MFS transporter [Propionibacteriaceae bacterium]
MYALALASGLPFGVATQMASTVLITEWFDRRRSFMLGLVLSIAGAGGILTGSVLPQVVANGGWQLGFRTVGVLIFATTILCGAFLIRSTPADVGLLPLGATHGHQGAGASPKTSPTATRARPLHRHRNRRRIRCAHHGSPPHDIRSDLERELLARRHR